MTNPYLLPGEYEKVEVRRLHVLLADDDEDDYLITRDLLSSIFSFEVELDWAPDYARALEAIERNQHDVYLVDYLFGEADGIDLVQHACALGCKAPIILLTGHDAWETDVRAMRARRSRLPGERDTRIQDDGAVHPLRARTQTHRGRI